MCAGTNHPVAADGAGSPGDFVGRGGVGQEWIVLPTISAGRPDIAGEGCVRLDPAAVLRATPRSFALRVRGCSMIGAHIYDGDIVVGEFVPQAPIGAIVVALVDGESTLKRLVLHRGRPCLASENPSCPDLTPLSELVVQGVAQRVVHEL